MKIKRKVKQQNQDEVNSLSQVLKERWHRVKEAEKHGGKVFEVLYAHPRHYYHIVRVVKLGQEGQDLISEDYFCRRIGAVTATVAKLLDATTTDYVVLFGSQKKCSCQDFYRNERKADGNVEVTCKHVEMMMYVDNLSEGKE